MKVLCITYPNAKQLGRKQIDVLPSKNQVL